MTYAMSMLSEVTTKTIRINMTTNRIKTVTNHNNTIRINFDSNRNGPWAAGHDERGGHDTNARCDGIAAQSVVAYLPIVHHVPFTSRRARASGRGGY